MPRDHIAADAEACGRPAASQADREQVIGVLKAAFVQGRLTREEFGTRIGQALMSRTRAELTKLTADLPPGLPAARVPRQLTRTRPRVSMTAAISAGAFAMIAALVILLIGMVSDNGIAVVTAVVSVAMVGTLTFGSLIVASWQRKAS